MSSQLIRIVYTIGHSSRSLDEFLTILKQYSIQRVIDVRRWPTSTRSRHFSREVLEEALRREGIDYVWIPELGGYRKFGVDVPPIENYATCFESEGFRAYAAYITLRQDVKQYLRRLEELVSEKLSALMCSERLFVRCHRKILSVYLVARGFKVIHIIDLGRTQEHKLSRCARIVDGELRYD